MRVKLQMVYGMKEHPESGVLLYPGDIFEVESDQVVKPPEFGGWLQRDRDASVRPDEPVRWVLVCAKRVDDSVPEHLILRDEPSALIGINISEKEYLLMERANEQLSATTMPQVAVSQAASSVAGVRRREAPPVRTR